MTTHGVNARDPATEQTPALWPGALEESGSLIGVELRRHDHQWNTEASPHAIWHFC